MELKNLSKDYLHILLNGFSCLDHCNILFWDEKMSLVRRIFPFFYKIPCLVVFYAALTTFLFKIFNGDLGFEKLAYIASFYVVCVQSLYRAVVLISKKQEIKAIILRLGRIWGTTDLSEEQIMKKNALLKRLNFRYAVFYWMLLIGSWQYMLAPLLDTLFRRYVLQEDPELIFPLGCTYPFDQTKDFFRYLAVYGFETYSTFHVIYCYIGSETILIVLSSHLSTEFTLLQHDLVNFVPKYNNSRRDSGIFNERNNGQSMEDLIRRHQELMSLAQDLDDIFNGIVFINLSCATIMICFLLVSIIIAKGTFDILKNFIAIFSGTYPIYNVCFHAELLKEASTAIADSAYQSLWYKGNKNHQKAIWFIIKRSQQPCYLTSMKYNKIALSTFKTVMSTTWSYFSLASSMYNE